MRAPCTSPQNRLAFALAFAFSLVASLGYAEDAPLSPSATIAGDVLIVLGSEEGTGVDPELAKIAALGKPPFDAFTKKTLLKRVPLTLVRGANSEVELPNGRKLRITWLEQTTDKRYRVSVSINRPGKPDYLPLLTVLAAPGDPFFVAGQKHEGGTLIIGVSIGKASP